MFLIALFITIIIKHYKFNIIIKFFLDEKSIIPAFSINSNLIQNNDAVKNFEIKNDLVSFFYKYKFFIIYKK